VSTFHVCNSIYAEKEEEEEEEEEEGAGVGRAGSVDVGRCQSGSAKRRPAWSGMGLAYGTVRRLAYGWEWCDAAWGSSMPVWRACMQVPLASRIPGNNSSGCQYAEVWCSAYCTVRCGAVRADGTSVQSE
jgi:hypothetical protein